MNRITTITISIILGLLAITIPVFTAIKLADEQSREEEISHLRMLSADIIRRSDAIGIQITEAISVLLKDTANAPCSPEKIILMDRLSLQSTSLDGLGYVENDRLMCSTLGSHGEGIPLGTPFINPNGGQIWQDAELPFAPNHRFLITANRGYASFINRDLGIDVISGNEGFSIGVFYMPSRQVMNARNLIKPEWVKRYAGEDELSFHDGEYLVTMRRSKLFSYVALVAVPDTHVREASQKFIKVLAPIGLLIGGLLATLILFLSKRRLSLKGELQLALNRNELFLVYQPVIDLSTGRCAGAEALVRWRRPNGKIIMPEAFIPVAESAGLIEAMTEKILRLIERDVPRLLQHHPHAYVAINVAAEDLKSERIVRLFSSMLARSGLPPENLLVEATERGFVDTGLAKTIVQGLRDLGLSVAIDDFGTGYSSLARLASFNLNYLKIDKLFVDTMGTDAPTSQVALHIVNMAKSLNLVMVAEGVETEAQARFLHEQGVQHAQGWLYSRALSIEELADYIDARAGLSA